MAPFRSIGVVHHGLVKEAGELASALANKYSDGRTWCLATQDTLDETSEQLAQSDLIITIGGDGTILRGAHEAAELGIPVLGINMGRVGFMSDLESKDALESVDWYLQGNARTEARAMLSASVSGHESSYSALNDVTVARGAVLRVIDVSTVVDGVHLATYRGDGVVVSSATGSTGYSLSLGGPVMDPESKGFIVKPIATHMSQFGGVILQSTSKVELTTLTEEEATVNIDGFVDISLNPDDTVTVTQEGKHALFLRRKSPANFWGDLSRRLGLRKGSLKNSRRSRR
jgi:NAD+ kinase